MGTAGGVKTTTIAVLILSIAAYLQGKNGCRGIRPQDP